MASIAARPGRWTRTHGQCMLRTQQTTSAVNLLPLQALRHVSHNRQAASAKKKADAQKKKPARTEFLAPDLKSMQRFTLCDAMRYIRAFEVGRPPAATKYELHVRLRTAKNGPVVRNRLRLPHPVKTDLRVCVICPADSKAAEDAKAAGAAVVGEEPVFDAVKAGRIEFDQCICHKDSFAKLSTAGVGHLLGPRQLMPTTKRGTVVTDVRATVLDLIGGSQYRERLGVVRMAVGQLGFSPEEMQRNIRMFIQQIKLDIAQLGDRASKEIHEVVLSSTHSPGFSLSGEFRSPDSVPTRDLSTLY